MKGGDSNFQNYTVPMFKYEKHSPAVSNIEKSISKERAASYRFKKEGGPPSYEDKPMVNLQVYDTRSQKPKPKQQQKVDPRAFLPMFTQTPYYPSQLAYFGNQPYSQMPQSQISRQVPIINNYTISTHGPSDNHAKLSVIYEDILPKSQFARTSRTLKDRLNIYNYIRSVLLKEGDGEDIKMHSKAANSILSYIKFMELNPYNNNQYTANPYKGLPDNMLIYRSSYPIKYDRRTGIVVSAENSIGINVRIYGLTNGEYSIISGDRNRYYMYDNWREIAYYEYIREQIVKKNICPNFVVLYAYYICEDSRIDFTSVNKARGVKRVSHPMYLKDDHVPEGMHIIASADVATIMDDRRRRHGPGIASKVKLNSRAYSGKTIVALTESPNYNLPMWATKTVRQEGNIIKTIGTGFHTEEEWLSVLFQLMVALYVMQLKKLAVRDFTIEDNVYIKDVELHGHTTNYWKYKINNIDYYIPNYGYVVMVDSSFKDILPSDHTVGTVTPARTRKIQSTIFKKGGELRREVRPFPDRRGDCPRDPEEYIHDGDEDSVDKEDPATKLNKLCRESFKNAFNPNEYTKSSEATRPPEPIMHILNNIYSMADRNIGNDKLDIDEYISTFMRRYMNNRIGTYLTEEEVKRVREDTDGVVGRARDDFKKGEMAVAKTANGEYKFVIYKGNEDDETERIAMRAGLEPHGLGPPGPRGVPGAGDHYVYTQWDDSAEIDIAKIALGDLYHYSKTEPIVQRFNADKINLNEDDLLETYIINKDQRT